MKVIQFFKAFSGRLKGIGFVLLISISVFPATFPTTLSAQQVAPGSGEWRTIHTPHFDIHFAGRYRDFARRFAKMAERVHTRLEKKYQSGASNTQVTLVFRTDLVNAFATPIGYDRIVLFLDSPRLGEFSRYDLWVETLFIHEYTHILTLRYDEGFYYFLRLLTVGVPMNMAFSPQAFKEGAAVHEESKSGAGRQDDPLTRMVLRTAIQNEAFPGPGEVLSGTHRWPFGGTFYLYGGRMMKHIADNYGEDALVRFWRTKNITPIFLDSRLRYATGKSVSLESIFRDYREKQTEIFTAESEKIKAAGLTPYKRLTHSGYFKSFLFLSENKDGQDAEGAEENRLLFFARPPANSPGIYKLTPDKADEKKDADDSEEKGDYERKVNFSSGIAEGGGLRIYSEDYFQFPSFGVRYELYDANRNIFLKRLAPGRHAAYPSLTSNGKKLYYIRRENNRRFLVETDINGGEPGPLEQERILFTVPLTGILQFTALSPDNKSLVTVARPGHIGGGQLLICNLEAKGPDIQICRTLVSGGPGIRTQPRFSPDGARVLFSSDQDGVYNLYQVEVSTGKIQRLTRTLTGLFYPTPAADRLYAIRYFKNGYDVVSIRNQDLLAEPVDELFAQGETSLKQDEFKILPDSGSPVGPGDPDGSKPGSGTAPGSDFEESSYLGPLLMRPYYTGLLQGSSPLLLNLGFQAVDPLFRHNLNFGIGANFPDPVAWANYSYTRYPIGLSLGYFTNYLKSDRNPGCRFPNDPLNFLCEDKYVFTENGDAFLTYVSEGRSLTHQLGLGYSHKKLRNARVNSAIRYDARDLNLNGPAFYYALDDTNYYPESISPEQGFRLFLEGRYFMKGDSLKNIDPAYREAIEYGILQGGLALYLPSFFDHHVNYLSASGYASIGPDREVQQVALRGFMRGISLSRTPYGQNAAVVTYEYRMPLVWLSRNVFSKTFMVRDIAMSLFYDYGAVFEKEAYRDSWIGSYGAKFSVGINLFYLPLSSISLTFARGTRGVGEFQYYFGFTAGLASDAPYVKGGLPDRATRRNLYNRPLPGQETRPNYFREVQSGGVF